MTTDTNVFKDPQSFHEQLQAIQPSVEANFEKQPEAPVTEEAPQQEELVEPHDEVVEEQASHEEENEEAPSEEKHKKENKYVPRSRLNELSEKKAALEAQVQKEREDRIRLETQLQMFMQQQQQSTRNVTPEIDLETIDPLDPDTHNVTKREILKLREELKSVKDNAEKHAEMMYLSNTANAQEAKFREANKDYEAALKHLADIEIFDAELEHGNKEQAKQLAAQKLIRIAQNAIKTGGNSAEILYNMAVKKGFKGESVAKASEAAKKEPNLDAIKKNMDKSASIGNLGTGATMDANSHSFDLSKLRKDPKNPRSKFDVEKFHKALQQIH